MSKTRVAVLMALFLAPFLFLMGAGSLHLARTHEEWSGFGLSWLFWAWWAIFLCFALCYFLASRWTRSRTLLPPTDTPPPDYWTERDGAAWDKVLAKAKGYERITTQQLADPRHYSDLALDLAEQVAEVYNPGGETPFDHLTIPEVLACIELASADLDELVQKYVPGSHMLRVRDYKRARKAADWYKTGQNLYWAGAAVFNPLEVGLRWLASRYALGSLVDRLQDNILLWFHTAFIHQLGRYLVELNSGRLRVGVKRYRELLAAHQVPPAPQDLVPPPVPDGAPPVLADAPKPAPVVANPVGIAILGAVKAGKSSLVNALIGQQAATVDTLPVPHVGVKYNLRFATGQPVTLLDTAGYGQEGPNEEEFNAATEASRQADLILLVTPATSPGRRPDVDLLDRLRGWFIERPQLKMPVVVVVVNQIDLLSPKNEWSPPYDWRIGNRPKEVNIRDCVAAVREQVGNRAEEVVPVCSRGGEAYGITEWLVPVIALQLDEARGAALLKAFDAEASADQFKRVGRQLLEGGKKAFGILWENFKK